MKWNLEVLIIVARRGKGIRMEISELSEHFLAAYLEVLDKRTSGKLWPPQAEAVKKGLLDFEWSSFVVSAPHGSGKTLLAELAIVKKLHEKDTAQILYLVPYKAMAQEIYGKFSFLQDETFGREIGMWTGDQAVDGEPLLGSNFLVLTYELFQLMLKSDLNKVMNVDLIIIDELHFIEEPTRGPRQEAAITRLLSLQDHPPILALCSVVSNFEQIQKWLGCGEYFVATKWRLNPLFEGIINPEDMTIEFYQNGEKSRKEALPLSTIEDKPSMLVECCVDYLQRDAETSKPQILVFVSTRRQAREIAQLISKRLGEYVASGDIDLSEEDIKHLLKLLQETTYSSSSTLGSFKSLFSTGVAYHHAGLGRKLRTLIEAQFREKRIVVLVATTTLGVGVNLPASRVYFLETKAGSQSLSPIKYRNMAGRAGRPQFREKGESIILSQYPLEMQASLSNYIRNPEPNLESYLLRDSSETESALLTWISQGLGTLSELTSIVSRSFTSPEMDSETMSKLAGILKALERYGFIVSDDSGAESRYQCTHLGYAAGASGARPDDNCFLVMNLKPEITVSEDGKFDRLAALFYICLTSRFDYVYIGSNIGDTAIYNSCLAKMDRSARAVALSARKRTQNAFLIASLLDEWISGKSLKDIGDSMRREGSAEELVERLVPNATEMLQYYLIIAERCGPKIVGSNENLISHLRTLHDCLELGTDTNDIELARLFRRRQDGRQLVDQLNALGISSPNELIAFPYENFTEESARMKRSDFFHAKARALLLVEDKDERKISYVRLLAMHRFVYDDVLDKLLSNPKEFEEGVRAAIDQIAKRWPDHLDVRQVRDEGAGTELPRPESYLVLLHEEDPIRLCFEAKIQQNGTPIKSHKKALSVLLKCRGSSTHKITIGWPSFHRNLHAIACDRDVTLLDSSTFALIYVWTRSGLLGIKELLTTLGRKGIIQPDAFDPRVPRWWPSTPSV